MSSPARALTSDDDTTTQLVTFHPYTMRLLCVCLNSDAAVACVWINRFSNKAGKQADTETVLLHSACTLLLVGSPPPPRHAPRPKMIFVSAFDAPCSLRFLSVVFRFKHSARQAIALSRIMMNCIAPLHETMFKHGATVYAAAEGCSTHCSASEPSTAR